MYTFKEGGRVTSDVPVGEDGHLAGVVSPVCSSEVPVGSLFTLTGQSSAF